MEKTTIRPTKPHFFKAITRTSLQEISIPTAFMTDYLAGEKCQDKAILTTNRSGHECSWIVSMKGCCLKDGWKDFARSHDLHPGDFLVFRHEGGFSFHVLLFDSTCCEREYPPMDTKNGHKIEEPKTADKKRNQNFLKDTSSLDDSDRFTRTLRPYNFNWSRMDIPPQFARGSGLLYWFRRERGLTGLPVHLKDGKGNSWEVILKYRQSSDTVYFRSGLIDFLDSKKLKEGDECTFTLVSRDPNKIVIEVSVCRSSTSL